MVLDKSIKCTVNRCENKAHARGWCHKHYKRWYRGGSVYYKRLKLYCTVESCNSKEQIKNMCVKHYKQKWYKNRTNSHK